MMRSLFSAIAGLKNHQFMMDVVGNNISNVNTVGFKSSRVTFQSIIEQTLRDATGPTTLRGGLNPLQVGLGSQIATVDAILLQGHLQTTGKITDIAIQGDGYLVLSDNEPTPTYFYTRDGNLDLGVTAAATDPRPLVHAASGMHVKGYIPPLAAGSADDPTPPAIDVTIPPDVGGVAVVGFNIDANGVVNLALANGTTSPAYAQLSIATFTNPGGLNNLGANLYQPSVNSGQASYNGASANGRGQTIAGFLEASNVDLAAEFTNLIIAERGFQANSRVITASDEVLQDLVNIKR